MAEWKFIVQSEIQAIVKVEHTLGKDELIVSVHKDKDTSQVQLFIQENEEDKGSFQLNASTAQQLFDWLKSKGVVS